MQIRANEQIVAASGGMLAPVSGSERMVSVGTGHTTAFCRAANHGCSTPLAYLQDAAGVIDLARLKRQPDFKAMLEGGWEWTVLPWQVELAWADAPDKLQRALNSSHEVHSSSTELEVAVTIAEGIESGESVEDALKNATAGNPPCVNYAKHLALLAQFFGGGKKVPLLHALDAFAKRHGENRRLGEEFLVTVVNLKFMGAAQFPRVIDAVITTNLVSEKVVDGVARTLTKTDLTGLVAKTKLPLIKAAERHLDEAEFVCRSLRLAGIDENWCTNEEGLFKVRVGAHLCGKGKSTFDGIVYPNIEAIVRCLLKSAFEKVNESGKTFIECVPPLSTTWHAVLAATQDTKTTAKEPSCSSGPQLLSRSDVTDKVKVAGRMGFVVNTGYVFEKSSGPKSGVYRLTSIDDIVKMEEYDVFKSAGMVVSIPFETFLKNWSVFKGEPPSMVEGVWSPKCIIHSRQYKIDAMKCELMLAMMSYATEHPVAAGDVVLCLHPTGLRANRDFAKGALILTPVVNYAYIHVNDKPNTAPICVRKVDGETINMCVVKPPMVRYPAAADWEKEAAFAPYFWVTTTSDKDDAVLEHKTVKVGNVSFNVLVNKQVVKKMRELKVYKHVEKKTSLVGVTKGDPQALKAALKRGGAVDVQASPSKEQKRG